MAVVLYRTRQPSPTSSRTCKAVLSYRIRQERTELLSQSRRTRAPYQEMPLPRRPVPPRLAQPAAHQRALDLQSKVVRVAVPRSLGPHLVRGSPQSPTMDCLGVRSPLLLLSQLSYFSSFYSSFSAGVLPRSVSVGGNGGSSARRSAFMGIQQSVARDTSPIIPIPPGPPRSVAVSV